MVERALPRVSDGVIVQPFGDGAVAADLITGRAYVLNAGAAWLLLADATSVDELVADLPPAQQDEVKERALDALDTLRTPGLVGRDEHLEQRPRPVGSAREAGDSFVGASHQVLAEHIAFRSADRALLGRIDGFLGSGTDVDATLFFDVVANGDGTLDLHTEDDWHFESEAQFFNQLPAVFNDYAVRSHDVIALHAGAVRTPDGRNLVFLGHMNVGKSTLTAACIVAGCGYFSDETIGIDTDLSLVGYPKPVTIDPSAHEVLGLTGDRIPHVLVTTLRHDATYLSKDDTIDEILLVRYDPEVSSVQHERLTPEAALEGLCAHTLNLARRGEAGLSTLCDVAEHVPVTTFVHPGVEVAVPYLLGH